MKEGDKELVLPLGLVPDVVTTPRGITAKQIYDKLLAALAHPDYSDVTGIDVNAIASDLGMVRRERCFSIPFSDACLWLEREAIATLAPMKGKGSRGKFPGRYHRATGKSRLRKVDQSNRKAKKNAIRAEVRVLLGEMQETDNEILAALSRRRQATQRISILTELIKIKPRTLS